MVEVYVCGIKCPKMCLKINGSVKTPWHRPSMGVARSRLRAPVMMMTMVIVKVVMMVMVMVMILNHRRDQYLGSGNNQGLDPGNVGLSRKGPRTLVYRAFDTY